MLYHRNNALLDEARALSDIGSIKGSLGETDAMLSYARRALRIHERTMNYKDEPWVLHNLAMAYESGGDYPAALKFFRRSLRTARANEDRSTAMSAMAALGRVYLELGDAENASWTYRTYLELATAAGSRTDRVRALNGIGRIHEELEKDYRAALARYQDSLELARLIGDPYRESVPTSSIGDAYFQQGRYKKALTHQRAALALVRDANTRFAVRYLEMQILNSMGNANHAMGRYREALAAHLEAVAIAEDLGQPAQGWKYGLDAGKALEAMGDDEGALERYRRAAAAVARIKAKIKSESLRRSYAEQDMQIDVYKRLIDLLLRTGRTKEALRYIEESKSKIVMDAFGDVKPQTDDEELQETLETVDRIEKKKEALQKQLVKERNKPEAERDRRKLEILTKTLATTDGEFNQWMLKLKFQNRRIYDALTIKPTTLGDIQQDIPAASVILEYFVADDKVYIFCIGQQLFFAKSVDIPGKELERLVRQYMRIVQNPRSPRARLLEDRGARLYDLLVRPVDDVIERFDNVVVVPFGILYYLPFHALVMETGDSREYLIERKRISYTTSATFTDLLKDERRPLDRLMAFGNPDGSLSGATEEVETLRDEIYGDRASVRTGDEATKEAFFAHAKDFEIVHLATHGRIQTNPLESYLVFAGASLQERRLTLLEVAGYTALRRRTGLVFLSACQTAMERSGGSGSELITLAEAFAMAGAPTLIATLWEVGDVSTRLLVKEFYGALSRGRTDKLEALRRAQISMLRSARYSRPFYWAPFVMIGNWR